MREQNQEYEKLNAFSRRPCATQIISYCVVLAVNLIFWLLIQNKFISQGRRFTMIVLFAMSLVVLLIVGFITSYLDPSDPVLKQQFISKKAMNFKHGLDRYLYCQHCRCYVFVTSRHCKQCDRCITRFDHHCIWINSCIGQINYKSFIVMIWAAFTHLFLFLVSLALLWSENNWQMFLSQMIVGWIVGLLVLIIVFLLAGLICLHSFLMYNGMTTFDYILSKKTLEEQKKFKNIIRVKLEEIKQKEPQITIKQRESTNNQNFKTQNQLPLPTAFQQIHQNLDEDKSDFPSLQCFKEPKKQKSNEKTDAIANPKNFESILFEKIEQQDKLGGLYKRNRSLKVLVGDSVQIKRRKGSADDLSPKSQLSRKSSIKINIYNASDWVEFNSKQKKAESENL